VSITGGCQRGHVRSRASTLGRARLCHHRMCERATGSAFAPLAAGRGVLFEGTPARLTGTPHDPSALAPALDSGAEIRLPRLGLADDPPRFETTPGGLSGGGPTRPNGQQRSQAASAAAEETP
jgi:hypothetical protein